LGISHSADYKKQKKQRTKWFHNQCLYKIKHRNLYLAKK
jgi:hypothetical protein